MNRFDKEQIRKSLHSSMEDLTDTQRRDFVRKFGKQRGGNSKRIINKIDNKLLKIAERHVAKTLKQNIPY